MAFPRITPWCRDPFISACTSMPGIMDPGYRGTLIGEGANVEGEDYIKKIHEELYHEKVIGL